MSAERRRSPTEGPERLEAFSDAVMAVIITILALGLRPPLNTSEIELRAAIAHLLIYVLAFVAIAIYWNNHHHLLRATRFISGEVMWANMLLLFWLSLVPVSAEWLRDSHSEELAVAFFGLIALAAALSYTWLVRAIIRANGRDSEVALAIQRDVKGYVSLALYAIGIGLSFVSIWLGYACYAAVAVMWLDPRSALHAPARRAASSRSRNGAWRRVDRGSRRRHAEPRDAVDLRERRAFVPTWAATPSRTCSTWPQRDRGRPRPPRPRRASRPSDGSRRARSTGLRGARDRFPRRTPAGPPRSAPRPAPSRP